MEEIKNKIQQLLVQGESQLQNIPKKSNYKASEKNIREKYRQNEPTNSIGREFISKGYRRVGIISSWKGKEDRQVGGIKNIEKPISHEA